MTISTTTAKSRYAGDGSTDSFPTGFRFLDPAHVRVMLRHADGSETLWTEGSEYALTGAGHPGGGTVVVNTSPVDHTPAVGTTLVVRLAVPARQDNALPLGGAFPSTAVEAMADLAALRDQQLEEALSRAPKFKATTALADVEFPEPAAGKPVGWNANGDALVNLAGIGRWRGDWQTATDYVALDVVRDPVTKNVYVCEVAHASSDFGDDVSAGKWSEAINVEDAEAAVTATAAAQAAAEAAQSAAQTAEAGAAASASAAEASASTASMAAASAGDSAATASSAATAAQAAETNAETAEAGAEAAQAAAEAARGAAEAAQAAAETAGSDAGTALSEALAIYGSIGAISTAVSGAQAAETAAEAAQSAAAAAEISAETAAGNAVSSATAAAMSATNAGNSATAAAVSASTAVSEASEAADSATTAANSAAAAATAGSNAETAEAAAEAAQAAAEIAQAAAQTAETNAGNSATVAAGSASTAASEASDAVDSATASAASASAAASSQTAAEAAQAAAEAAQASAEAAAANGIAIVPRGAYSAGTIYSEDDGVPHLGSFWRSLQNGNQGNAPDISPTFWEETVAKGEQGDPGEPGADGEDGDLSGGGNVGGNLNMQDNQILRADMRDYSVHNAAASGTSGAINFNYTSGPDFDLQLGGNVSDITITNWPPSGPLGKVTIQFRQPTSGAHTVDFTGIDFGDADSPTMPTGTGALLEVVIWSRDGGATKYGAMVFAKTGV